MPAARKSAPEHPALASSADWLLKREVRRKGDWSLKRPNTEPSGWAFEYTNEFYPDIDDTAMVMLALSDVRGSDHAAHAAAAKRGLDWLLAMQSGDGGWAAFDADNNWEFLSQMQILKSYVQSSLMRSVSRSTSGTFLRGPGSGIRSNIGCFVISRRIGGDGR